MKAVAFLSDFTQSNLFHVTTKKKRGKKKCPAGTGVGVSARIFNSNSLGDRAREGRGSERRHVGTGE